MLIDGNVGLRAPRAVAVEAGQPSSAREQRVRRVLVVCASVVLLAAMAYIAATYGLNAVARCEVETSSALGQGRSAMSQIALSNACGF
jgi:hypothetical protein